MEAPPELRCPACARPNRPDRRFCGGCGALLGVACASCGSANDAGERFCGNCGVSLLLDNAPEAERRQLSVLFCDLVGSTELAARLDPEDWFVVVERYQHRAREIVTGLGGHVAKFLGDGLLIYFGWPQAHDDDAERAVRAGLALTEMVGTFSAGSAGNRLAARVAVHTGGVVVEPNGEIFGEAANLAARLQSVAAPGAVVVTNATRQLVAGWFDIVELGCHALKGVAEPVAAYHIVGARAVHGRLQAIGADGLTPFVGRGPEQSVLQDSWEQVCGGCRQTVVVVGEPGIGKSRLVLQFRSTLGKVPHTWLESAGSAYHQHTPLFPVVEVLRQGLRWRGDESSQERLRSLERSLEAADVAPTEAVPLVAPMLDLDVPRERYPALSLSPEQHRRRLLATLVAWVSGAARARPLVILLEDLQWVDPSTLELHTLLQQEATGSLLLLYTARPEFQVPWPTSAQHVQIVLSRLEKQQARQLVTQLGALADDVVDTIVARTDGVPLFVEELTKSVLEVKTPGALAEIPSSLQDSLMARLDRLGPEKQVAQLASVIGREFPRALLESLAPGSATELDAAIARLVEAGLVLEGDGSRDMIVFKHALVQEAAYSSLLLSRRRQIHGQVARALEGLADRAAAEPEVIARHFAEAGETQPAIDYYRRAGDQAMQHSAHAEAIQHFSSGIALVPDLADPRRRAECELSLQIALGTALVASRGYGSSGVERSHKRAYELCAEVGTGPALHQALSGLFLVHQARAELEPAAERAAELLGHGEREHDDFLTQWGCFFSSVPCYYRGDYRAALSYLERGLSLHERGAAVGDGYVHEHDVGVSLLCYAAMTGWTLGAGDRALGWIERAVELGAGSSQLFNFAFAQSFATLVHSLRRDFRRVLGSSAEVVRICAEQAFPDYLGLALIFDGWAIAHLGDANRGLDTLRRGMSHAGKTGTRIEAPRALGLLADVQLLCGRTDEAFDSISTGLAIAEHKGTHYWDAELLRLRGVGLLGRGADEEATACFQQARAVASAQQARALELRAAVSEAECLRMRGDLQAAERLVAPVYAGFREGLDLPELREARALLDLAP